MIENPSPQKYKDSNKKLVILLVIIIGIIAFFVVSFKAGIFSTKSLNNTEEKTQSVATQIPEIEAIKSTENLTEQKGQYQKLIDRVGPSEAQDDLYLSGLPFTGQTHLLNHLAGDYLYKKFGAAGLVQCKDYFLSSCYHGFLLHAIAQGGMAEISKTYDYCRDAGFAVASQCAHAMGHGFLANVGYKNLTKALTTCDEAVITIKDFPPFNCYDGVFMENIWAVHDGTPSPDRWVKESDIMYPCNDKRIDKKYLGGCWSNQPSLIYQYYQGDVKKVADNLCAKVTDENFKQTCFDGLARQIHPLTEGKAEKVLSYCSLMPDQRWKNFCTSVNAGASYSVGDHISPFQICGAIDQSGKEECYSRVISMMKSYQKPGENLAEMCAQITDKEWQDRCQNMNSN
ncbi:MAG: hypothetical protein ABIS26_02610 [Candidatus Paceibacterota bacterium]